MKRPPPPVSGPGHFLNQPKPNTLAATVCYYIVYSAIFIIPSFILIWCIYDFFTEVPMEEDPQEPAEPTPFFTLGRLVTMFNIVLGAMAMSAILLWYRDRKKRLNRERKASDGEEINYISMYVDKNKGRNV